MHVVGYVGRIDEKEQARLDPDRYADTTPSARPPHPYAGGYHPNDRPHADPAMNALANSLTARTVRLGHRLFSRPRIDLPLAIALAVLAIIGLTVLYGASNLDTGTLLGQSAAF